MVTLEDTKTGFEAGNIVFTIVIVLVFAALSALLVWSIMRERKRRREEKDSQMKDLGLMTRKGATQVLDEFIKVYRLSNEASVFIFELNNVSELVESFGKKNEMLIREKMIQNLVASLPKNTILAEYKPENDSYMVIIRGMVARERLLVFADSLCDTIERTISVPGTDIETAYNCYMGISFYPSQAIVSNDLINKADLALYMNHKIPDKRYAVYSNQFSETEKENVAYYNEVRNAIKNKEFTLYYQPIVDYNNDKIVAFEALIRWEHPTLGLLPPKKFLTILENSGDIVWVGKWSVTTICTFYNENVDIFRNKNIFFSINLSVKQLLNPNIVNDFSEILKKYNVPTSAICLEIEEYALYEKYQSIFERIDEFAKKGFKVAVDQFGLDSNNIVKLEKKPLYMVKISSKDLMEAKDSFVTAKMTEMLVETCSKKKINICSLMTEDLDSIHYMSEKGVNFFEGYFIAEPMNKNNVIDFVKTYKVKKEEEVVVEATVEEKPAEVKEQPTEIKDEPKVEEKVAEVKTTEKVEETKEAVKPAPKAAAAKPAAKKVVAKKTTTTK